MGRIRKAVKELRKNLLGQRETPKQEMATNEGVGGTFSLVVPVVRPKFVVGYYGTEETDLLPIEERAADEVTNMILAKYGPGSQVEDGKMSIGGYTLNDRQLSSFLAFGARYLHRRGHHASLLIDLGDGELYHA